MSVIKQNQSTLDLSTQLNGDAKSVIDFCIANDFSVTQDLLAGLEYVNSDTSNKNEINESFFFNKEKELATSEPKVAKIEKGIGTMIVGSDFIVT